MSMSESDAIKRCNMLVNGFNVDNATETAFTDIERGYATFATMVEFAETCKMALEIVQELHAIGTVSEFRELKEKANAVCKWEDDSRHVVFGHGQVEYRYKVRDWSFCPYCGMRVNVEDWSEGKE